MCSVLSVFAIGHGYASTWRDDFDEEVLYRWERIVEENSWFAKWILLNNPGRIYSNVVKYKQEGVCLFIGKRQVILT